MTDTVLERAASGVDPLHDDRAKRRQILDGARQVFMRNGFDAASMNEIARVAGVSKGTLYVYFDSKEALFEVLIRQDKRAQAEQTCRLDEEGPDLRQTLEHIGYRLVSRMLDPALVAQLRTVIAVSAKFPRIGQAYYEAGPQFGNERMAAFFKTQTEAGLLTIEDFELAAQQFGELCKSPHMLRAILCMGDPPSDESLRVHIAKAVDVFLRAYGAPA